MGKRKLSNYFQSIISCIIIIIIPLYAFCSGNNEFEELSFLLTFMIKSGDEEPRSINYSDQFIRLTAEDNFRLYIEPIQNAYIYIFIYDESGNLALVFPEIYSVFDTEYYYKMGYFIPDEEDWFYLEKDSNNLEIYIIAASKRLNKLEKLASKYISFIKDVDLNPKDIIKSRETVLNEIKTLRQQHSFFKGIKENLIPISGSFRGLNEKMKGNALVVNSEKFYSKTIRIYQE